MLWRVRVPTAGARRSHIRVWQLQPAADAGAHARTTAGLLCCCDTSDTTTSVALLRGERHTSRLQPAWRIFRNQHQLLRRAILLDVARRYHRRCQSDCCVSDARANAGAANASATNEHVNVTTNVNEHVDFDDDDVKGG